MNRRLLFVCTVLALGLVCARPASAAPIVSATFSQLADGSYQYNWVVDNADGTDPIFDLGLFYYGPVDDATVTDPTGWSHVLPGYDPATGQGFIDWFSPILDDGSTPFDLLPGASLAGFSFISALGPGAIQYAINGDLSNLGATTGPNPVPEPGSLFLLGTGLSALWMRRRRSVEVS
jgi:hypothetical protein